MDKISTELIGKGLVLKDLSVDNSELVQINSAIRYHDVEIIGEQLRAAMDGMKSL